MKNQILIIGKIPPPTGGVTIHVSRIIEKLKKDNVNYVFIDLKYKNLLSIFFKILKYKNVHLHSNSTFFQFYFILLTKILNKNSILTIHAEIGQHNLQLKNQLESISIKYAKFPILLNIKSYNIAKIINENTILDSAYISPSEIINLPIELLKKINKFKEIYKKIFCTNAYNRVFDKNENELYGIDELIQIFKQNDYLLIICDPSGSYKNYYKNNEFKNVYFINYNIHFVSLLHHVDGFIRNTTSDGDSISIHESLQLNKPVFCTNVVDRPNNVILYKNALLELPNLLDLNINSDSNNYILKENKIFDLYKKLIQEND